MSNSTSLHVLNADNGLSKPKLLLYWGLNLLNNNILPNATDLRPRQFVADISDQEWHSIPKEYSANRRLSDLFWMKLPWNRIAEELGKIHIVDAGCGTGEYGVKIKAWAQGRLDSYLGMDLHPSCNWNHLQAENPKVAFKVLDSANIRAAVPPEANFFMSQAAIEHFESDRTYSVNPSKLDPGSSNFRQLGHCLSDFRRVHRICTSDLTFFQQIREIILRDNRPAIQLHMFPSSACLRLYPVHGIRQYTPRTVAKIAALFEPFSEVDLFSLGDSACNALHWQAITKPTFQKKPTLPESDLDAYVARLRNAVRKDMNKPARSPHFYALAIASNISRNHSLWETAQ